MNTSNNAAILIDCDGVGANVAMMIMEQAKKYGNLAIRRAYGNWRKDELARWPDMIEEYAIRAVQQFDFVPGKNATDMAMTVDAMDLLYGEESDIFHLVASDYDFAPLAIRLREAGKVVIGWGKGDASEAFQNACAEFHFWDHADSGVDREQQPSREIEQTENQGLLATLIDCLEDINGLTDWDDFIIKVNKSPFRPEDYGYKRWWDVLESLGLFERPRINGRYCIRLASQLPQ